MALPVVTVARLAELQALAVIVDAHEVIIESVDAVRLAPEYLEILVEKTETGWICGQEARIRKVVRFAELLVELSDDIVPALNVNATDKYMVHRLGSNGDALRRISSRICLQSPPAMVLLARPLSTIIRGAARQVLRSDQPPAWFADRLQEIAARVQVCLNSAVDLEALPTAWVDSLVDVQALAAVADPHDIHIRAIHAIRDAPQYLNLVMQKKTTATGWRRDQEASLRKVVRFSNLLTDLSDVLIPALQVKPADVKMIRRLRSRGGTIADIIKVKRRVPPSLVPLAGPLGNKIQRDAASVLKGKHRVAWLAGRLEIISAGIQDCLDSYLQMEYKDEEQ